jgi:hypothetical protein
VAETRPARSHVEVKVEHTALFQLFVAARSRHKAVCWLQGFTRSPQNGWSCFSGDIGRRSGLESWFYVDPL